MCRNFARRSAACIRIECSFKRRDSQLVGAQRAIERMCSQALDDFSSTNNQSGLRSAEQFVAAERNDIDAGRKRFANHRLASDAVIAEVN